MRAAFTLLFVALGLIVVFIVGGTIYQEVVVPGQIAAANAAIPDAIEQDVDAYLQLNAQENVVEVATNASDNAVLIAQAGYGAMAVSTVAIAVIVVIAAVVVGVIATVVARANQPQYAPQYAPQITQGYYPPQQQALPYQRAQYQPDRHTRVEQLPERVPGQAFFKQGVPAQDEVYEVGADGEAYRIGGW